MPSLFEMIVNWPLTLKFIPLALIGLVTFGVGFFVKPRWLKFALMIIGLVILILPLMVLVLVQFSNM